MSSVSRVTKGGTEKAKGRALALRIEELIPINIGQGHIFIR